MQGSQPPAGSLGGGEGPPIPERCTSVKTPERGRGGSATWRTQFEPPIVPGSAYVIHEALAPEAAIRRCRQATHDLRGQLKQALIASGGVSGNRGGALLCLGNDRTPSG